MKKILLLFIPLFSFGQKDISKIECNIKSLKTTFLESSKIISEVKYKVQASDFVSAKIDRIYGRFEDLKRGLSLKNFKENKIDFICNEHIVEFYDDVYYSQQNDDPRKFYAISNSYIGTEDNQQIKKININNPKKYLLLYNKERENDDNYEVTFNYLDNLGRIEYAFHQRGNEFDEYTYEYEKNSINYTIYKNESVWEEHSYGYVQDGDDSSETVIRQYIVPESYQLDKKNNPDLKRSRFFKNNKDCNCKEGYITKIELWDWNKCTNRYILEQ